MIVLDASAVVELVLRTPAGEQVMARLLAEGGTAHVPELLDVEVLHALRRVVQTGQVTAHRAERGIDFLARLGCERYGVAPLRRRIWQLRDNLTAYDATYVALAEALDATLVTRDARLARAPGVGARVEVVC